MICKTEFKRILSSLFQFIVSKSIVDNYSINEITDIVFDNNNCINRDNLKSIINNQQSNVVTKSLIERVFLVTYILEAYSKSDFDSVVSINTKEMWKLVYNSIKGLNKDKIFASVGSQGFLSIPLYRYESICGDVDILRLHIWDKSLNKYIDKDSISKFSIHSHTFSTQSWILSGEIYNTRYTRCEKESTSDLNYFRINFSKSLLNKQDNNKESYLENTYINSKLIPNIRESYKVGETYRMDAGEFHLSQVNNNKDINATLFLFSSRKSRVDFSYVLGNKDSILPRKLNYEKFDCKYLIDKLNSKITAYE